MASMLSISQARKLAKRLILGAVEIPQQCPVGMHEPQAEIAVWLHSSGTPRDVTFRHLMACGAPFTIAVAIEDDWRPPAFASSWLSLQFRSRQRDERLLGEIALKPSGHVDVDGRRLQLFQVGSSRNYCMPALRLWAHYLLYAYRRSQMPPPEVPITEQETRAMIVFYSAPRPVVLVSVTHDTRVNIFTMNLLGAVGPEHFAFALNSRTPVSALVERSGFVALSSIPIEQAAVAFQLGKNHRRDSMNWKEVGFGTMPSSYLALPVPDFALRVREMRVEAAHQLGSHTLFLARTIAVEDRNDAPEFFMVHGIYQTWRAKNLRQGTEGDDKKCSADPRPANLLSSASQSPPAVHTTSRIP